jgi:nicotinate phosphoribosyltransferase
MSVHPPDAALSISGLYTDRYQLTMAQAYWVAGRSHEPAVFDYFFRSPPFGNSYALFAGAASLLDALDAFHFADPELEFLRSEGFPNDFLDCLRALRFRGSIWLPPEGEPVFPNEPVARVEGGLLETQLIETLLLNILNFQSLIATKAARCRLAARGRTITEFGLRRAQGMAGRWASRAAMIGGCSSTSNLDAAHRYGLASAGTMSHAFIQSWETELAAFRHYARVYGSATILLLDTYDTLQSGLPNAIRVGLELAAQKESLAGVRLDSGDLTDLAPRVRQALDQAGLRRVKIVASNQLDEFAIHDLVERQVPIDIFGVGTALATGSPDAALDGVFKLSSCAGRPCLKRSETTGKSTLPGRKSVARFSDAQGQFRADAIHLADEPAPDFILPLFHDGPTINLSSWTPVPLLHLVLQQGQRVAPMPAVPEAAIHALGQEARLPVDHRRVLRPQPYPVGISQALHTLKDQLLHSSFPPLP